MNPIARLPLFLGYALLMGSRPSPQMLPRAGGSSQSASADSYFSSRFMGGGMSEMLGSIFQMLNFMPGGGFGNGSSPSPVDAPPPVAYRGLGPALGQQQPAGPQRRQAARPGSGQANANTNAEEEAPATGPRRRPSTAAPEPGNPAPAAAARGSSIPSRSGEPDLDRWDAQIQAAAEETGLPANYIKATMWAESRGRPETESHNDGNGHTDYGLMQISDHTYGLVRQTQDNAPSGLKAEDDEDNIRMGAWELKDKVEKADGDLFKASKAYVGTGDAHEEEYAGWVQTYKKELDEGKKLSDF